MDSAQRLATSKRLRENLQTARDEYDAASKRFMEVVAKVPSATPAPDGPLRLQQAGEAARRALHRYMEALTELHGFETSGNRPSDK
jgi:hypothetical protein